MSNMLYVEKGSNSIIQYVFVYYILLYNFRGAREATQERSLVLTRSTYPSSGKYAGHWLGDNDSDWVDMADSIIGIFMKLILRVA